MTKHCERFRWLLREHTGEQVAKHNQTVTQAQALSVIGRQPGFHQFFHETKEIYKPATARDKAKDFISVSLKYILSTCYLL